MQFDLAKLMKQALDKNKKELRKISRDKYEHLKYKTTYHLFDLPDFSSDQEDLLNILIEDFKLDLDSVLDISIASEQKSLLASLRVNKWNEVARGFILSAIEGGKEKMEESKMELMAKLIKNHDYLQALYEASKSEPYLANKTDFIKEMYLEKITELKKSDSNLLSYQKERKMANLINKELISLYILHNVKALSKLSEYYINCINYLQYIIDRAEHKSGK